MNISKSSRSRAFVTTFDTQWLLGDLQDCTCKNNLPGHFLLLHKKSLSTSPPSSFFLQGISYLIVLLGSTFYIDIRHSWILSEASFQSKMSQKSGNQRRVPQPPGLGPLDTTLSLAMHIKRGQSASVKVPATVSDAMAEAKTKKTHEIADGSSIQGLNFRVFFINMRWLTGLQMTTMWRPTS